MSAFKLLYIGLVAFAFLGRGETARADAKADFQAGIRAAKSNRLGEAKKLFEGLLKTEPTNPLYLFNYANVLFLEKDFAKAAAAYRKVAFSASPLAAPAKIYLVKCERALAPAESGLSAYQAGDYQEAIRLFERDLRTNPGAENYLALGMARLRAGQVREAREAFLASYEKAKDAAIKEDARSFLSQLNEGYWKSPRKFYPEGKIAFGYSNNFYTDAKNGLESPVGKAIYQASAQLRQLLREEETFQWNNRYYLAADGPFSEAVDRTMSYGLETQSVWAGRSYLLASALRFDHFFAAASAYYMQPSLALRARRYTGKFEFGFDYGISRPIANSNEFRFLAGTIQDFSVSIARNRGRALYGASLHYRMVRTGDYSFASDLVPLRHRAFGPSIFVSYTPSPSWELYTRLAYDRRLYPTLALPGGVERRDHYLSAYVYGGLGVAKNLRAFLSLNAGFNRSTMGPSAPDDKNYNEFTAMNGLTWSYE